MNYEKKKSDLKLSNNYITGNLVDMNYINDKENFTKKTLTDKDKSQNNETQVKMFELGTNKADGTSVILRKSEIDPITKQTLDSKRKELNRGLNQKVNFTCTFLIYYTCLRFCIFKPRKIVNFLKLAFKKLNKYQDFLRIIKNMQELHKMKKILLTKNQRNLISVSSVQIIDDDKVNKYLSENSKTNKNDFIKLYESYVKGKEKAGNNKLYKKILENLDENLKVIFDNLE